MLIADKKSMYYIEMEGYTAWVDCDTVDICAEDILTGDGFVWDNTIDAYVVDDAEIVVAYAQAWENFETKEDKELLSEDESVFDDSDREVYISDVTPLLFGGFLKAARERGTVTVSAEGDGRYLVNVVDDTVDDITEPFPATHIEYTSCFIEALKRYNDLSGVEIVEY